MKSNVSDYLELVQCVYIDACAKCTADVSDLRDLITIKARVKKEGMSFLTITLPQFSRDFERSLALGFIDSTLFRNFRKNGAIPAFLQGMTSRIFDHETGRIIDDKVNIDSSDVPVIVESIRQICLTFKKLELECTSERTTSALENFIAIERSLSVFSLPNEDRNEFRFVSSVLWDNLVCTLRVEQCIPRHGSGATADRISGNQKYDWRKWHDRLEPYFPLVGYAFPIGIACFLEELEKVTIVAEVQEQPVKVIPVPKTLKGPRIIAIEPCCMQYAQQGIRSLLYDEIESFWLTSGHINFRDQSINQRLAVDASTTGQLATIDLSDASDRVPHDLAMEMFDSNPSLKGAIEACRSTRAKMPDGQEIGPLFKFASMGSALCFPIEAMYFYTLCVMALLKEQNLPVNLENCYAVTRDIHVYGDDIIVPTTYAVAVLDCLQKYNCKVNATKTFWSGSFRESCGVDAYRGLEVTPTYLGKQCPKDRQQSDRLISWVETANLFYKRGYWRTAQFIFSKVECILGPLPYLAEDSPGLGKFTFQGFRSAERWNEGLQRLEVKAWIPESVYRTDALDGFPALMKSFLDLDRLKNLSFVRDVQHLERSALHHAVALKRGWVPST